MDPRLLRIYNRELQHLREMGAEFAREFPKIAARLGLEGFECTDPYVERLLEGFAFLTSRVQLKIDAEFPRFTRHLLEAVYPHYLAPTPSMAVVQFVPSLSEGALAEGFALPRGTALRTPLGKGEQTSCEFRTAHEVVLWPLEVAAAEYLGYTRDMAAFDLPGGQEARAALRIRLRTAGGMPFSRLALDRLVFYLRGAGEVPARIYEQFFSAGLAVVAAPARRPAPWHEVADGIPVRQVGFEEDEALLPFGPRSFRGYRLLHEYFSFPERYLFVEIGGIGRAVRRCEESELDLTVLLGRAEPLLQGVVDAGNFALYCAPALNLFPMRADTIHLTPGENEHHVVPDRTRPLDFEVHEVTEVVASGAGGAEPRVFKPLYAWNDRSRSEEHRAYYTVNRVPRALPAGQRRGGTRSSYVGSETYLALVDGDEAPYGGDLTQVSVAVRCTNRDLPLLMAVGQGRTDFTLEVGAPVDAVRCVTGPTRPRPSLAEGETAWRLVSHLSLNYLSLVDTDEVQGAVALRDLLLLYGGDAEPSLRKQVEGVRSVESRPIHRRIPGSGPIAFGRGVEVTLTFDEAAFEGSGAFLLGAVLDRFLAKYVSLNSFTETVVKTTARGELKRWPTRTGLRPTL